MQDFILILVLGIIAGHLASRFGQPSAAAQVLLGIIIGPPLLGWINSSAILESIGQLGIVLMLGMAGLHMGLSHFIQHGWTALWVAVFGIFLCLMGGYVFTIMWGSPHEEAIYVGTALAATSIGISVQVLSQLGLIDHEVGKIVVTAAVIDDVLALYLLATAHELLSENMMFYEITLSMIEVALVLTFIYFFCRWGMRQVRTIFTANNMNLLMPFLIITVVVLFGWVTESLGYSMVVGSFFAGLGIGGGIESNARKQMVLKLRKIVPVLVPFFFVLIGSRAEWYVLADSGMISLVIGLLIIAIIGKALGGYLAALRTTDQGTSLLIGMSMVPRGEVMLIIAGLGFFQEHISHHMLVALILVTIVTAVLSPLIMAQIAKVTKLTKNNFITQI